MPLGRRPHNIDDGLVKVIPERLILQKGRPHIIDDGLVEHAMLEPKLVQRARPHDSDDGLVECTIL